MKVENISLTKSEEQCRLTAYLDNRGTPTIGWGSIYLNGRRVVLEDVIIQEQADQMFETEAGEFDAQLNKILGDIVLPQNKYDALWDFLFNEGEVHLMESTLLRKVKADPNDITIPNEFMKWIYSGGKVPVEGLIRRRGKEIALWLDVTLDEIATKWVALKEVMIKQHIA